MNKRQKEVLQLFIDEEKATLNELKKSYKDALDDINYKLSELMARQDADLQHVIYQIDYQKSLKGQVQSILEELHSNEFETLSKYLTNSYTHGYVGTMYDIAGQGIPLIMPIDQNKVLDAIKNETKLNENLYTSLGHDIKNLQKTISAEISRGISTGLSYTDIARNLKSSANIPMNRAMTIARTEAHRIQCKATSDAQEVAKSKGADVLKQWDASLDGATRDTHRQLDGQIRELDEPFSVGGKKAKYPGAFGDPAEDCNCRCALLQRARWALDEEELAVLKERAAEHGLDKADDFADYEKKFLKASEDVAKDRLNIFTNNNKSNPKYYDFKGKDLKTVENDLRNLDYEVGVIFDNGKAISCQLGTDDTVAFTRYQYKLMKGKDVTHNHPLSTPPSPEDLYLVAKYKMKSFRTCGKNGTYVLEYSKEMEKLPNKDTLVQTYDNIMDKLLPEVRNKVSKGMAKEEALIKLGEDIWEELYTMYGIKPTFERR